MSRRVVHDVLGHGHTGKLALAHATRRTPFWVAWANSFARVLVQRRVQYSIHCGMGPGVPEFARVRRAHGQASACPCHPEVSATPFGRRTKACDR